MSARHEKALTPEKLTALSDADIDFSDIPELDDSFWNRATVVYPEGNKTQLTVRFDSDLVEWFKAGGKGYQTRMNAVLRAYVQAMRKTR